MWTNGFGKRGGKLGEHALCGGSRLDPIEPGGQHKRVDDFDLALAAPGSVAKSEAQLGSFVDALIDEAIYALQGTPVAVTGFFCNSI